MYLYYHHLLMFALIQNRKKMDRHYPDKSLITAVILAFNCFSNICQGQSEASEKFMGDIMGHEDQIWSAEDREKHTYNYDSVFTYIKPAISEADIAIANFEVTLAGPPYSGWPSFSSPAALAVACKNAGIDCMVTANNHAADRKTGGIKSTIRILDSIGILHTGTFNGSGEREILYPLMLEKNGISLALLNYTFGTNGIRVEEPAIVNTIDRKIISEDIAKAKSKKPDIIVVFLHWGNEYDTVPSKSQYDLAEYLFNEGADLVIGSHPHVLQKMIWLKNSSVGKGRVTVYSLGNFVSDQQKQKTKGGAMARIEITRDGPSVRISDADYYLTWVYTPIAKYRKKYFVIPCSEYENKSSFFPGPEHYKKMKKFMNDSRTLLYKQNINIYELIFNGSSWLLNF
jgi:poly-gamma-glutamate capsule biosynthesis protein CapA/YwtB (metallophosphatase superfamily)